MTAHLLRDAKRIIKATLTNQIAHFAPDLYVRLTGETGRGFSQESPTEMAAYFRACFDDYFAKLGVSTPDIPSFLTGKRTLEYGPGDLPGVALLMVAHGAEAVVCVDRFALVQLSKKNLAVINGLLGTLSAGQRLRALSCFLHADDLAAGFNPNRIRYTIDPSGLSGLHDEIDLVLSRAVLEHVNDLPATFADMHVAMKRDAIAIHLVDLKSHGMHQTNPLDFLTWPDYLWRLMYKYKGVPNRIRVASYLPILDQAGFEVILIEPTLLAEMADVNAVRPALAAPFRELTDEALRCLGFWLICRKKMN